MINHIWDGLGISFYQIDVWEKWLFVYKMVWRILKKWFIEISGSLIHVKHLHLMIVWKINVFIVVVNSSPAGAANIRQRIGSILAQIVACRLIGTKPFPKPMLFYCELKHYEFREYLIKIQNFSFTKKTSETIVCGIAGILSRRIWVKCIWPQFLRRWTAGCSDTRVLGYRLAPNEDV